MYSECRRRKFNVDLLKMKKSYKMSSFYTIFIPGNCKTCGYFNVDRLKLRKNYYMSAFTQFSFLVIVNIEKHTSRIDIHKQFHLQVIHYYYTSLVFIAHVKNPLDIQYFLVIFFSSMVKI